MKRPDELVSSEWLAAHLDDPSIRLVEVDVSPAAHREGHIPGAVLWDIYQDLKDPDYDFVEKPAFEQLVQRSGISPDSEVVFYGYAPALGYWLLKLYGHDHVRILDVSRDTWKAENRPWTIEGSVPTPSRYTLPDEDPEVRASMSVVEQAIHDPGWTILDVRSELEHQGERFWPSGGMEEEGRAGHVPSAINIPADALHDERGAFRSALELSELFAPLDECRDQEVITYCTIGARASTAWFVLTRLLGHQRVRVYDGSWAEWGRAMGTPVET